MKYENVEYRIGKYAFARGSFQDLRNYLRSGTIGETPRASLPTNSHLKEEELVRRLRLLCQQTLIQKEEKK